MFKKNRITLARAGINYKLVVGVTVFGTGNKVDLKLVQLSDGTNVKIMEPLWFNSNVTPVLSGLTFSGWTIKYTDEVLK